MNDIKVEVICIGTELLAGNFINTNAVYISNELFKLGLQTQRHTTVPDNPALLYHAIKSAVKTADLVVLTGGLGPTVDDITLTVLAKTINKKLTLRKDILKEIQVHFNRQKIIMPKNNIRQAYIPKTSLPIKNQVGTAPGLIIKLKDRKTLIALPGPPREMMPMMENSVIPYLKRNLKIKKIIKTKTLKIAGLAESQVNELVEKNLKGGPGLSLGIYAHPGQIEIKITATGESVSQTEKSISSCEKDIRKKLRPYIFGVDSQTLEGVVADLLFRRKKTVAVVESCTGGLLSNRLTNISGSSKYLLLSVVAYSNKSKIKLLKVPQEIIKKYGAVSPQTAVSMAKNIKNIAKSDIGISITGIAGPTGGTREKPVGLVCICLVDNKQSLIKEFNFAGTREMIKLMSTQAALDMLRRSLVYDG